MAGVMGKMSRVRRVVRAVDTRKGSRQLADYYKAKKQRRCVQHCGRRARRGKVMCEPCGAESNRRSKLRYLKLSAAWQAVRAARVAKEAA